MKSTDTTERFCAGSVLDYALTGLDKISGDTKHQMPLDEAIREEYGTSVSKDTAQVLANVNDANESQQLVDAISLAGLDEVTSWDEYCVDSLAGAMRQIETVITDGWAFREYDAVDVSDKNNRRDVYVPALETMTADGGTVYMAKTLSSTKKIRMAWDLHPSNQVVVVDEYEVWEDLLGWEKLKQFPHGKNKIREEFGEELSDDVLEIVVDESATSAGSGSEESSGDEASSGRATRTKPSEEVLNLARGSRHKERSRWASKEIAETFADGETIGVHDISMLVLFPTTAEKNMTDYWWIPGSRGVGEGSVAIANCNKGTFEYLNQYDAVWHVDEYLEQASAYEFTANVGRVSLDTVSHENLVMHIVTEESQSRLMQNTILDNISEAIIEYVDENKYSHGPEDLPHPDDIVYAPVTPSDVFWMRPELRGQSRSNSEDVTIYRGDASVRDIPRTHSVSSDYMLYSRARLPNWDFDSIEMQSLDDAKYDFRLDEGGYEMLELLGRMHDRGERPFSKTPQARWSEC